MLPPFHFQWTETNQASIEDHVRTEHPEADPMTCGQCKFSAFHGPVLVTHAMSTHEKRKCRSCDFEVGTISIRWSQG